MWLTRIFKYSFEFSISVQNIDEVMGLHAFKGKQCILITNWHRSDVLLLIKERARSENNNKLLSNLLKSTLRVPVGQSGLK